MKYHEWILCEEELPPCNKLVLFCLNTDLKTVYTGTLDYDNHTPLGCKMWHVDGTIKWYKLEDVLAWYAFPPCPFTKDNPPKEVFWVTRPEYAKQTLV